MALGDFPYPIVDLRLTHIAAGLNEVKKLKSCCLSANTIAEGLDPVYCPGADAAARLANLKADRQQTYWKNYYPKPPGFISSTTKSSLFSSNGVTTLYDERKPTINLSWFDNETRYGVLPAWTIMWIEITSIIGEVYNEAGDDQYFIYNGVRLTAGTIINVVSGALQYGNIILAIDQIDPDERKQVSFAFKLKINTYKITDANVTTLIRVQHLP